MLGEFLPWTTADSFPEARIQSTHEPSSPVGNWQGEEIDVCWVSSWHRALHLSFFSFKTTPGIIMPLFTDSQQAGNMASGSKLQSQDSKDSQDPALT